MVVSEEKRKSEENYLKEIMLENFQPWGRKDPYSRCLINPK
jgi:hypothetical protein